MKRVFACIAMLAVLVSLCVPAFAAEAEFTPSVSSKPAPVIVPTTDDNGNPAAAVIRAKDGNAIGYVELGHLIITAISEANTSTKIPADARDLLLEVNDKLLDGSMQIDYTKHGDELKNKKMVIRDLFDATFVCDDCSPILEEEGVTMDITFDIGVSGGVDVYVMTYKNSEWNPIVKTVNNGDGTVTCTFEKLCPVEFSVVESDLTPPTITGDQPVDAKWFIIGGIALAAIVVLTVVFVIDNKKHAAH